MSSRLTKKSFRQRLGPLGEDAVRRPPDVCAQDAQTADKNRHLRRRQGQQLRPIHQQLLGRHALRAAEGSCGTRQRSVRSGSKESTSVCSCDASMRPGVKRDLDVVPGGLRRFLDRRAAAENDQVGNRDLLAAGL